MSLHFWNWLLDPVNKIRMCLSVDLELVVGSSETINKYSIEVWALVHGSGER